MHPYLSRQVLNHQSFTVTKDLKVSNVENITLSSGKKMPKTSMCKILQQCFKECLKLGKRPRREIVGRITVNQFVMSSLLAWLMNYVWLIRWRMACIMCWYWFLVKALHCLCRKIGMASHWCS